MNEILKEKEEGKEIVGTSPTQLNNAAVPTLEEEENAGIEEQVEQPEVSEEIEEPEKAEEEIPGVMEASTEKMFTQSQVDEIAGKARKEGRERALRETFSRYGVDSEEGLDELFGDAQRYTTVQEMYDADKKAWEEQSGLRDSELAQVKQRVALLESGIDKERYEDAKFILTGKGLEVTAENIMNELATHPEWKSAQMANFKSDVAQHFQKKTEAPTQIKVLGNESSVTEEPAMSEHERAMKLFFRH